MIYLFNSAYRALYTRNVLNTLFIPKGGTNEYRYRAKGAINHIAADSYGDFVNAASNEPIAITFIDRFGDAGYVYHPLRIGKLVTCREEQDRLFFRVILEDFVYPRDFGRFNRAITQSLGPRELPCLRGSDPFKADDGYYAIKAGSLFTTVNDFHWGDDAWENAVENLRKTRAFIEMLHPDVARKEEDIAPREFIFVKCDICSQSTQRELVVPQLRKDMAVFDLLRGERYEFLLSYRYPPQLTNTSCAATVEAKFGENLRALGSTSINIDSYSNSVPLPFATKRHLEDNEDGVSFEFTSTRSSFELIGPDARLLFRFRESKPFWIILVILLLAFTTLSVVIGADLTKISPLTIWNVVKVLWLKALAGFLQAAVLFFLFRLMGKKFL
jgi:hypothetical protein